MSRVLGAFRLACVLLTGAALATTPAHAAGQRAAVHTYTTAHMSVARPRQNSTETVTATLRDRGRPGAGALMRATWHYKTTSSSCDSGVSDANGYATCGKSIGHPSKGYTVNIDVAFTVNGTVVARTQTAFTPQ